MSAAKNMREAFPFDFTNLGQIVRHSRLDRQHSIDSTAKCIDLLMFIAHENLRHTLIVDNVSDR